jgi:predicted CDP-diglyceride synthetase/phosphatidate cytidylyltransferase
MGQGQALSAVRTVVTSLAHLHVYLHVYYVYLRSDWYSLSLAFLPFDVAFLRSNSLSILRSLAASTPRRTWTRVRTAWHRAISCVCIFSPHTDYISLYSFTPCASSTLYEPFVLP